MANIQVWTWTDGENVQKGHLSIHQECLGTITEFFSVFFPIYGSATVFLYEGK